MDEKLIEQANRMLVDLLRAQTAGNVHVIANLRTTLQTFSEAYQQSGKVADKDREDLQKGVERARVWLVEYYRQKFGA